MIWLVRGLGGVTIILTLLPFIRTGYWLIRGWDFPRLQLAAISVLVLILAVGLTPTSEGLEAWIWATFLAITTFWQISHVIPFSPLWWKEVPDSGSTDFPIRLMVVNLRIENNRYDAVAQQILEERPQILLLIENDDRWTAELAELRTAFSFQHDEPQDEGLGMALWTNLPVIECRSRYLVSARRVSIWATLELPGGSRIRFVGVHPTPPGLLDATGNDRRNSRVRDAELLNIATEVAENSGLSWVVAGDFNDVAWSHTTRLFKRTSGLSDPRIGRSFLGTFVATVPVLRCPIDQVFVSSGFSLISLGRKKIEGSDHFAVLATLALENNVSGALPKQSAGDADEVEQLIDEGVNDACERGLDANES